jgi:hypothetical protein
VVPKF